MDLRQSTATTVKVGPFLDETNGITPEEDLTITQSEVRLTKNGGNLAQKNEATSLVHDEVGYYDCLLDGTDTNTAGRLKLVVSEGGALRLWENYDVLPANVYDSKYGSDKLQVDAVEISSSTAAANAVEANIGNLDASVAAVEADTQDIQSTLGTPVATIAGDIATIDTELGTVDTNVDSILVDTNELQTDWVNGGRLDLILDARASQASVDAIDIASLEADVTAILADTDELQGDWADAGRLDAILDARASQASVDTVDNNVDSVLADTNELQGDWVNGGRLDLILDARASQTTADAIETDTQDIQSTVNAIDTSGIQATADAIETDTQNIQSRLPTALVSGRMDSNMSAIADNATAALNLERSASVIKRASVISGPVTTTEMPTNLTEATDDHYNGRIIIWTSGALFEQATDITDYDGTSKNLTYTAVTEAPSDGDTFVIV